MQILLKPLELALNQAIKTDSESQDKLKQFSGRSIRIDISNLDIAVIAHFSGDKFHLQSTTDDVADLMITADSFTLLQLLKQPDSLFSNQVRILGDVQFAKQLQDWQQQFDFDWEQQLASITGDTLAYPLAQGLRHGFSWLRDTHAGFQRSLAEYLREESRYLPDSSQTDRFMRQVDHLRADVDRLEARVKRLQATTEKK